MTRALRSLPALALLLFARAALAEDPLAVALLSVTPGPGVVQSEVTAAETAVVKELGLTGGLQVMTRVQAAAALDAAHRKQLAKCRQEAACFGQIGAIVQADLAATLEIAHVAKGTSLTLALVAVKSGKEVARVQQSFKAKPELAALAKGLASSAVSAARASPELSPPPPPVAVARKEASAAPAEEETTEAPAPAPKAAPAQAAPVVEEQPAEEEEPTARPAPRKKRASRPPSVDEDEEKALARTGPPPAPPTPTRNSNGFVIGFDFGYGLWGAEPERIVAGTPANAVFAEEETSRSTAAAFTAPLDKQWRPNLNLHLGWNILGYGSIEAVFQMSWWDVLAVERGGVGLAGGRATLYPFQFFMPNRSFDIGLEGGGGYSIGGGPTYGMDGSYAEFGVVGEYYLGRAISIGLFYRLFLPMWNHFLVDYNNHVDFPVSNFMASFNTLGLTINFHVSP